MSLLQRFIENFQHQKPVLLGTTLLLLMMNTQDTPFLETFLILTHGIGRMVIQGGTYLVLQDSALPIKKIAALIGSEIIKIGLFLS